MRGHGHWRGAKGSRGARRAWTPFGGSPDAKKRPYAPLRRQKEKGRGTNQGMPVINETEENRGKRMSAESLFCYLNETGKEKLWWQALESLRG